MYLVNASASALKNDDLQQFGSVTLCILACIYGQHLQVKGQSRLSSTAAETEFTVCNGVRQVKSLTFLHML